MSSRMNGTKPGSLPWAETKATRHASISNGSRFGNGTAMVPAPASPSTAASDPPASEGGGARVGLVAPAQAARGVVAARGEEQGGGCDAGDGRAHAVRYERSRRGS